MKKVRLSSFQMIIIGFALLILIGALFLMCPFSTQERIVTPFKDALFTATSAACVTGLVVCDTASYWSYFGQTIILLLIQIGGLGIITLTVSFAVISGRKISLMQRGTMQEAISAPKVGGIVRLTSFIIRVSLCFELLGTLIMMPVFCKQFGVVGVWKSFFHSISAFCNAGFDLMGSKNAPFVSLTSFYNNPLINITIMLLIIIGGIGFLTWDDIWSKGLHFRKYRMQSKVILVTTFALIIVPAIYLYFYEFNIYSGSERIFASLFQSVTTRTAGFNTMDLTALSGAGLCIMIILMIIGGSPGSTAGGMKTTTFAVLIKNAMSVFRKKEDTHFFGRRIEEHVIKNASTIAFMYFAMFISGAIIISIHEQLPLGKCLFETASAIGTVGLSLGITSNLRLLSKLILIAMMFVGRVGGLTVIYATILSSKNTHAKLPQEKITVG